MKWDKPSPGGCERPEACCGHEAPAAQDPLTGPGGPPPSWLGEPPPPSQAHSLDGWSSRGGGSHTTKRQAPHPGGRGRQAYHEEGNLATRKGMVPQAPRRPPAERQAGPSGQAAPWPGSRSPRLEGCRNRRCQSELPGLPHPSLALLPPQESGPPAFLQPRPPRSLYRAGVRVSGLS